MKNTVSLVIVLLFFSIFITGCFPEEIDEESAYRVYYLNNKETKIEYYLVAMDKAQMSIMSQVELLLGELGNVPAKLEYKVPLGMQFSIVDKHIHEGYLTLEVDDKYLALATTTEVLVRAALVRTLTQIEGVDYINMLINGNPLIDKSGNLVGMMSENDFIDNPENEKKQLNETEIVVYFANSTGDNLIKTERIVENNGNQPLERLVMEELIQGPQEMGGYPTINSSVSIVNMSIQDGICYVNLDQKFLVQSYNITTETVIYSIVNSLVELPNINKVQILIEGKTDIKYREKIDLNTIFERNIWH